MDTSDGSKSKCKTACPYDDGAKYYVDATTDSDNPKCVINCPANHYIDDLTTTGLRICVPSCLNLEPTAYIYADSTISNR